MEKEENLEERGPKKGGVKGRGTYRKDRVHGGHCGDCTWWRGRKKGWRMRRWGRRRRSMALTSVLVLLHEVGELLCVSQKAAQVHRVELRELRLHK